jgi:hypothetical protein
LRIQKTKAQRLKHPRTRIISSATADADNETATSAANGIPYHLSDTERRGAKRIFLIAGYKRNSGGLGNFHYGSRPRNSVRCDNGLSSRPRYLNTAQFAAQPCDKRLDRSLAAVSERAYVAFGIGNDSPYPFGDCVSSLKRTQTSLERIYCNGYFHL